MTGQLPEDGKNAKSKSDKQKFRPPTILFVWGRFTFKGVVESLSQKYTMFLSDGTPVRAECALKIRNVIDTRRSTTTPRARRSTRRARQRPYQVKARRSPRPHRRQRAGRRRALDRDRRD